MSSSEGKPVTGRAAGGFARAEALSPARRRAIAKRAAEKRWNDLSRASHQGEVRIGEASIPCAVVNGVRVLSQQGFLQAIGRARSAKGGQGAGVDGLPAFLAAKNIKPFIDRDLVESTRPIHYFGVTGARAYGYRAELLPKVCNVYLAARDAGVLTPKQQHIADLAGIMIRALAKTAIVALVDEATGYQDVRPQDALQKYLELIIRKELAAWVKKFPDEFYENIYKLKGWPWPGMSKNRYSVVAHYTRDLVYERMAPGLLEELEKKSPKNEKGHRNSLFKDWLSTDVGDPMLAQHLHSLIMFQRLAIRSGYGWKRFVSMVDQVLPKKDAAMMLPFMDASPTE